MRTVKQSVCINIFLPIQPENPKIIQLVSYKKVIGSQYPDHVAPHSVSVPNIISRHALKFLKGGLFSPSKSFRAVYFRHYLQTHLYGYLPKRSSTGDRVLSVTKQLAIMTLPYSMYTILKCAQSVKPVLLICCFFLFFSCRSTLEPLGKPLNELAESTDELSKRNQLTPLNQITELTGSVHISQQGIATIKVEVFAEKQHQFDFFLYRDKPQSLLDTGLIAKAHILIPRDAKHHVVGLVIDDLTTHRRFILGSNYVKALSVDKPVITSNSVYPIDGYGLVFFGEPITR